MPFLVFACIVSGLPMLYPLMKILRLKDITLLDLLMLFSGLYFCIIPIASSDYVEIVPENEDVFLFYSLFSYSLLCLSLYVDRKIGKSFFRSFLRLDIFVRPSRVSISIYGYVFLSLSLAVILLYYIPNNSFSTRDVEVIKNYTYTQSSIMHILSVAYNVVGLILALIVNINYRNRGKNKLILFMYASFFIMIAFLSRRNLLFHIVLFAVVFYKMNRDRINAINISVMFIVLFFMYYIWFPFYNVIRNNDISFDATNPIQSFNSVIDYGMRNWDRRYDRAFNASESRSVNVYNAVLLMSKAHCPAMLGSVIVMEIDVAIPRVINPNKGTGSEHYLQEITGYGKDMADSYFLELYADFKHLGGTIVLFVFVAVFVLYSLVSRFLLLRLKSQVLPMVLTMQSISICWNVEGKLGGAISFFFSGIAVFIILFIVERLGWIRFLQKKIRQIS